MKVSQQEMLATHVRILDSAARLVRSRGVQGTGVADVMKDAGLTHGGFYRHFDGKDALVAAAIRAAFDEFLALLDEQPGPSAVAAFQRYKDTYLSSGHVQHPEAGCPIPALGGEMARDGAAAQEAFQQGVADVLARIAHAMQGPPAQRRETAMRELAMLVGAVTIARTVGPELGGEILASCRK